MWKQIKDFKDYEVNENGEIRSLKHGKETILKGRLSKDRIFTLRTTQERKGL